MQGHRLEVVATKWGKTQNMEEDSLLKKISSSDPFKEMMGELR